MSTKKEPRGYAVVVQFPPHMTKNLTKSDAERVKKVLSKKLPTRTGRTIKIVRV